MTVLQFRQRPVKGLVPKPKDDLRYFCRKCQADSFVISAAGAVSCYSCGGHMSNLYIADSRRPA